MSLLGYLRHLILRLHCEGSVALAKVFNLLRLDVLGHGVLSLADRARQALGLRLIRLLIDGVVLVGPLLCHHVMQNEMVIAEFGCHADATVVLRLLRNRTIEVISAQAMPIAVVREGRTYLLFFHFSSCRYLSSEKEPLQIQIYNYKQSIKTSIKINKD